MEKKEHTDEEKPLVTPGLLSHLAVCVSFRTWSGPAWSPAQSISSVLISIQSLMTENPYHNEPGFEQVACARASLTKTRRNGHARSAFFFFGYSNSEDVSRL